MKAASLLFLRISTGLLLVLWGLVKIAEPQKAIGIANKYYDGLLSDAVLQMPWGALQVTIGVLVVIGLFRKVVYPLQALMLGIGALAIWRHLLDPFGRWLFTEGQANLLFFPSLAVAAATLVLIAFKADDTFSLDRKLGN